MLWGGCGAQDTAVPKLSPSFIGFGVQEVCRMQTHPEGAAPTWESKWGRLVPGAPCTIYLPAVMPGRLGECSEHSESLEQGL